MVSSISQGKLEFYCNVKVCRHIRHHTICLGPRFFKNRRLMTVNMYVHRHAFNKYTFKSIIFLSFRIDYDQVVSFLSSISYSQNFNLKFLRLIVIKVYLPYNLEKQLRSSSLFQLLPKWVLFLGHFTI